MPKVLGVSQAELQQASKKLREGDLSDGKQSSKQGSEDIESSLEALGKCERRSMM